ncbi:hypothetical protein DUNSADRAFT_9215 [Dunaliella salina]|uniref:Uncharacterized protein n=1 Tax=Dunaliella salina TaxID=3046 RepID=A0ABQ7GHY5_DUNSA|nr:hypothetical protein DUNSADRAFT_9215 [Dunaliella salina]|eukprot:KAF5834225.1 hypothetical protein DUNSADRAFT_9215 [Dunaliella salina]
MAKTGNSSFPKVLPHSFSVFLLCQVDEDLSVGEPGPGQDGGGPGYITDRTGLSSVHVIIIIVVICVVVGGICLLVTVAIIGKHRRNKRHAQALSLSEAQAREAQAAQLRAEEQARVVQALKLSEEQVGCMQM